MEEDKEEGSKKKLRQESPPATAASLLTDDLILEILSRLPARSVRRFKCVSTAWRDLIADPIHRKKLRQTIAGFFYEAYNCKPLGGAWSNHFASVSGSAAPVDPSLPFLQPSNKYKYTTLVDTCNGLLLCARYNKETAATDKNDFRYVVCNPATERWIELPPPPKAPVKGFRSTTRLAFNPAVSSHFHVLEFVETILGLGSYITGVDIFSSKTRAWIHRDSPLVEKITLSGVARSVFFGSMLLQICGLYPGNIDKDSALLVVDMEGKAWKTIRLPNGSSNGTIGLSQGSLCYASTTRANVSSSNMKNDALATEITLWYLENYDSKEWVLKHSASLYEPLGISRVEWRVFEFHPDCSTVFFVTIGGDVLASYDLQHQKFVRILNLEKSNLQIYLPYVPLFSEALADDNVQ